MPVMIKNQKKVQAEASIKKRKIPVNNAVLDAVCPLDVDIQKDKAIWSGLYTKLIVVYGFPNEVNEAWQAQFANQEGVISSFHITPVDMGYFAKRINKTVADQAYFLEDIEEAPKQAVETATLKKKIRDQYALIDNLINKEKIFYVTWVLQVLGKSEFDLENRVKTLKASLDTLGFSNYIPVWQQEEGIKSVLPFNFIDPEIERVGLRNMSSSAVAAAFPFNYSSLNDTKGVILGVDKMKNFVMLDFWRKDGTRTNSNIIITGTAGSGKSTATKKIISEEYCFGTQIIAIDPADEYQEMCNFFGGQNIDMTQNRINPLEPNDLSDPNALRMLFQTLRTFFKFLLELDNYESTKNEEVLEETYKTKGITFDTPLVEYTTDPNDATKTVIVKKFKSEDYPIFTDLYEVGQKMLDEAKTPEEKAVLNKLVSFYRRLAMGSESIYFNGHTTLKRDSNFVVVSTSALNKSSDSFKKAQYFLILNWAYGQITKDRTSRVMLIADEAHLIMDRRNPDAARIFKEMFKCVRKFEGSIVLITQEIDDFLFDSIIEYGKGIVANASYKLFMRADNREIVESISKLFTLNEAEKALLLESGKGDGLLVAGGVHLALHVTVAPWQEEVYGRGGGR